MSWHPRPRRLHALALLSAVLVGVLLIQFKVDALYADVVRAEQRIVALERENVMLEMEVQARSSQAQLAFWNRVEFGLQTPGPDQFITSERELARFSAPRDRAAPVPLRFAGADGQSDPAGFPILPDGRAGPAVPARAPASAGPSLADRARGGPRLAVGLVGGAQRVELSAAQGPRSPAFGAAP